MLAPLILAFFLLAELSNTLKIAYLCSLFSQSPRLRNSRNKGHAKSAGFTVYMVTANDMKVALYFHCDCGLMQESSVTSFMSYILYSTSSSVLHTSYSILLFYLF